MKKKLIYLVLAGTTTLTACKEEISTSGNSSVSPTVVSKEDAVASVNGQYISKEALATLEKDISQRSRGQTFPKEKLLEELIQRELLTQDALQKKLNETPEFNEQLENVKKSLLSQASIQNHLKSNPITDADLKAQYDKNIAKSGDEYKARHILVKTEDDAKKVIAELQKGADFAELAKKKSTGPSGPKGGDLGWFAAGQMVPPFSEAVIALEDNKFTLEPVKTQFGYHVILREGSRPQTPPPFDKVKEQMRPMLQRQKVQDFLTTLRTQANVEIMLEKPEAPAAPPKIPAQSTIDSKEAGNAVEKAAEKAKQAVEESTSKAADSAQQVAETIKDKVEKSAAK